SSEIELQLEEVTKAKAQIVIYAPSKVISKMVNFWNGDPSLSSEQGKKAFVAMLYAMRADTFQHDHLVSEDDLKLLLLGKE
ncbi:MAG TPA: hypothetical protein VFR02_00835, partial [bacterium]|nr:hypothetical protein [bacterium]